MDKGIVIPFALMVLPIAILSFAWGAAMPLGASAGFETGIVLVAFSAVVARVATRAFFRVLIESVARVLSRGFSRLFVSSLAKNEAYVEPGILKMQSASILHRARIIDRLRAKGGVLSLQIVSFALCWLALGASLAVTIFFKYGRVEWLSFIYVLAPLAVYVLAEKSAAGILGIRHVLLCPPDAVLVQFYFAGAVSFLPLANESHLYGSERQNGLVSLAGTASLVLLVPAILVLAPGLELMSLVSLLFMLISTFPIKPMAGNYIWKWNKAISLFAFLLALEFIALFGSGAVAGIV